MDKTYEELQQELVAAGMKRSEEVKVMNTEFATRVSNEFD